MHVSFINAGAELIETNSFGANRRKLAQHHLEDELERINSAAVKLARDAREITGREVLIGGVDRADRRARPGAVRRAGADPRGARRRPVRLETFYDLDELEVAIGAVRSVSGLPIVALMSFDSDAVTIGGVSARAAARAAARARRRGVRREPRARAGGGARRARGDVRRPAPRWRRSRTSGLATFSGARLAFPHATPEYFGEFAARARALGARVIGGCCGTTPAQIAAIRAAVDDEPRGARRRRGRGSGRWSRCRLPAAEPTELERLLAAGEFVVSVQLDPPLGGSVQGLVDAARRSASPGLAQVVDVNDNPRARARMSGMMASVAIQRARRDRGRPAPDAARLDDRRARVAAARRARRGGAERPRGDGRRAGAGRLSGLGLGVRRRRDRARRADDAPERGCRLPRPRDRRADVVLPGRRRQPDRGRPRAGGGAVPAEGRGGRALRDDAGRCSTCRTSSRSSSGSAARRSRCSSACGRSARSISRCACTTRRRGSSSPTTCRSATAPRAPDAAAFGVELVRGLIDGRASLAAGVYVVAPFRRPLGVLDVLAYRPSSEPVETGLLRLREVAPDGRGRDAVAGARADSRREHGQLDLRPPRSPPGRRSCRGGRARSPRSPHAASP